MNRIKKIIVSLIFAMVVVAIIGQSEIYAKEIEKTDFLKTQGKVLRNNYGSGSMVILRGVNAGGWLLQELWMCPTSYSGGVRDQKTLEAKLVSRFGEEQAQELLDVYYDSFWTEKDFDICVSHGMNVIRLPFWYLNIVDESGNIKRNAFERIDWFIEEAGKRGIYVILDMHGAPGSQNDEDHSGDINSNKGLWQGADVMYNQSLYIKVWKLVAEHYEGNPIVAGYDLLNEPYCAEGSYTNEQVWDLYDRAYEAIREIDGEHIIIMEGTWEPYNLPDPDEYNWKNIMYEYHSYNYDNQTDSEAQLSSIKRKLRLINQCNYNLPSYIGETSFFGNTESWEKCLSALNEAEISWTLWSYKVTGDGTNTWGIYNMNIESANLESDSYNEIKRKWQASVTDESCINKGIADIIDRFISFSPFKVDIGNADVSSIANQTYTFWDIKPKVVVKYENKTLVENIDYTINYSNNVECGTATVTITGIGVYDGINTVTFKIVPEKLKNISVTSRTTRAVTLKWDKSDNAEGYYIYQYKNGKYVRIATLKPYYSSYKIPKLKAGTTYNFKICSFTIIDKQIYEGKANYIKTTTKVAKPELKAKKIKVKGKKIIISWKRVKGSKGYEIFCRKGKKIKKITSGKITGCSYKVKESGTYSIKIRAYNKIDGKKVYGKFSKIVKIKVK